MEIRVNRKFHLTLTALAILLLVTMLTPLQSYAGPFQGETRYSAAGSGNDVTIADFNNDSYLDFAVAGFDGSSVTVWNGNGDGTFGSHTTSNAGGTTIAITNADFNRDGNVDVATVNWSSNSVSILLGNGDGTFASAMVIPVGRSVHYIVSADLNKDGIMDLAVSPHGGSSVFIMIGNGDGTFEPIVNVAAAAGTSQIAIGDFNADGNPDLAVSAFVDQKVSVLLGNGDGTFAPKVDYSTSQYTQRVATADLNKDGHLDLVAVNSSGSISILLGNGDGTFQNRVNQSTRSADPRAILIGDFVGDGEIDIIVGNFGSSNLSIFSGIGDGTFETATTYPLGIGSIFNMVSSDFNGDSVLDLAFVTQNFNHLHVLLGNHRNADLQNLSLSGGAVLDTPFGTSTFSYTSSVGYSVYGISVIPTLSDATATVTAQVYGGGAPESVDSGMESSALPLNVGANKIEVVVTAQDGTTIQTYTIDVTRGPNTDANLSGLGLSGGVALSPSFSAGTPGYTASVPYSQNSIRVTPVADTTATVAVRVNGGAPEAVVGGGTSSDLPLNLGLNTIEVTVTAQDGTTAQTYTIDVTRDPNTEASLSGLSLSGGVALSPSFSAGTSDYTSNVPYSQNSIRITPVADATATIAVRVNGGASEAVAGGAESSALPLNTGLNTIEVIVTAQDGTTVQSYTVNVTRQSPPSSAGGGMIPSRSANANLSKLSLTGGIALNPAFTPSILGYTSSVANSIDGISLTPILEDKKATVQVRVNGGGLETVASGSASGTLPLKAGKNVLDVIVTAEDGTSKSYTISLTRQSEPVTEPQAPECSFTDIQKHWAKKEICEAAELGIVEGMSPRIFMPNAAVTRTEFAVMLLRTLQIEIDNDAGALSFSDSDSTPKWAVQAIRTAVGKGILTGYPDGTLKPVQTVSRSEMAAMVSRAMKWQVGSKGGGYFSDESGIPNWAKGYVEAARERGVLTGRSGNRFAPEEVTTRAEAAVVLLRLWKLLY